MKMNLDLVLIILVLNTLWKWLEPKVLEIQRINLKTKSKVPLKTKKKLKLGLNVHFDIKSWTTPTTIGLQPPTHMLPCLLKTNHVVYENTNLNHVPNA